MKKNSQWYFKSEVKNMSILFTQYVMFVVAVQTCNQFVFPVFQRIPISASTFKLFISMYICLVFQIVVARFSSSTQTIYSHSHLLLKIE